MSEPTIDHPSGEGRINKVLAEYLTAQEAGQQPDHQKFLARYPELTAELQAFFADEAQFDRFAAGLPPVVAAIPAGDGETAKASLLGTVRYVGDYELHE